MRLLFVIALLNIKHCVSFISANDSAVNIFYWRMAPLIVDSKRGYLPEVFRQARYFCHVHPQFRLVHFRNAYKSQEELLALLYTNVTNRNLIPESVDPTSVMLGPFLLSQSRAETDMLKRRRLVASRIYTSSDLVVVVKKSRIYALQKIFGAVQQCADFFSFSFLLTLMLGMLLWMFEHRYNSKFPQTFLEGSGKGIWCSFVTMTTVGYGDIFPVTFLGRSAIVLWIMLGLVLGAVLTASIGNNVSDSNDIHGKVIAVLQNTTAANIAKRDFQATLSYGKSYEEVFHRVKEGGAFAALVNSDVVAAHQHHFNDRHSAGVLRAIMKIKNVRQSYYFLIPDNGKSQNSLLDYTIYCITKMYAIPVFVYPYMKTRRFPKVVTIEHPSFFDLVIHDVRAQVIFMVMFALIACCFVVEFVVLRFTLLGRSALSDKCVFVRRIPQDIVKEEVLSLKLHLKKQVKAKKENKC